MSTKRGPAPPVGLAEFLERTLEDDPTYFHVSGFAKRHPTLPIGKLMDGELDPSNPIVFTIFQVLGCIDEAVKHGFLTLTAPQRRREDQVARREVEHRRTHGKAFADRWERNREADLEFFRCEFGHDSPAATSLKNDLAKFKRTRARQHREDARFLAGLPSAAPAPRRIGQSRTREQRPRRRTSSSSSTSSDDPGDGEPEPPARSCAGGCGRPIAPRSDNNCGAAACRKRIQRQRIAETSAPATIGPGNFCACGCNRPLQGKRAGTKFFGASCCTKAWRARQIERSEPAEVETCQCTNGFFYRDADGDAVCGHCGCWLERHRDLRVDGFDFFDAFMRANGPTMVRRRRAREWRTTAAVA